MRRISGMTILVLAALLSACAANPSDQSAFPSLRIGVNPWVGYGPLYIAAERGFFAQEGVDVELVNTNYDEGEVALAMKQVDANAMVFSDAVAQAAAGIPLQLVWVFDNSAGGDVVVGSSDVARPEDLRGKRIGFSYGTFSQLFVSRGLANYGLTPDDVTVVNLPQAGIPAALAAGQIDAGHTVDPYLAETLQNGGHILFTSADTPGVIVDGLAFQSQVARERPEDVQAVVRALAAATQWWLDNPDEGNQLVARSMGIPPQDMAGIMSGVRLLSLSDNLTAFSPFTLGDQSLYESARFASELFAQSGIIDQTPDLHQLINSSFVQTLSEN